MNYIPYHIHSVYSILDGALELGKYVEWGKVNNLPALTLTDHGTLAGVYQFWQLCKENKINPIIGMEAYVDDKPKERNNYHLTIIAKNNIGFRNLVQLNNRAVFENFYYKPRLKNEWLLEKKVDGIFISTACIRNEIAQYVLKKETDKAEELLCKYYEVYGDDFCVELQFNELPEQHIVNEFYLQKSAELGIQKIVGLDAHYLEPEDYEVQNAMHRIRSLSAKKGKGDDIGCKEAYVKTISELLASIHKFKFNISRSEFMEAVKVGNDLASVCDVEFNTSFKYPKVQLDCSPEQYFLRECKKGLLKKYKEKKLDPVYHEYYTNRMNMEYEALKREKFITMFVIIHQQIKKCNEQDIWVGPGRGSVAGVFCAYLLGIVALDPIKYDLLFERFCPLTEGGRVTPPDIDIDFEDRNAAIEVLKDTYGESNVLSVSNFTYYKPKSTIIDVLRINDVPPRDYYKYSKAYNNDLSFDENFEDKLLEEFKNLYPKPYALMKKLSKKIRQLGKHAAAAIVLPKNEVLPMTYNSGSYLTQYDGRMLESHGFAKLDYLGLDFLAIIKETVKMANIDFDFGHENVFDPVVYRNFSEANVVGIFQFDAPATVNILEKIPVTCFDDLMNVTSIIRPNLDVEGFIRNCNYFNHISYAEGTKHIFESTKGVLIYQEQVMKLCTDLAGFTLYEADKVRKIIAKKTGKLAEIKEKFIYGAVEKGHHPEVVRQLWESIEQCGSYIFNKSHACAYSYISYNCMWLKCYYPIEYLAACLKVKVVKDDKFKFAKKFVKEAKRCGIEVVYPDVNYCNAETMTCDRKIYLGLNSVKGVGKSASVIEKKKPYKSIEDFVRKLPRNVVSKTLLEVFANIGAFRSIESNNLVALKRVKEICSDIKTNKFDRDNQQLMLFDGDKKESKDYSIEEKRMYQIEYLGHSEYLNDFELNVALLYQKGIKLIDDYEGRGSVCGFVKDVETKITKRGKEYLVVTLGDDVNELKFNVWNEDVEDYVSMLQIGKKIIAKLESQKGFPRPSLVSEGVAKVSDFNIFLK